MSYPTQPGMTPPAPGQEKEEPDLWNERDIPTEDEEDDAQAREAPEDRPR